MRTYFGHAPTEERASVVFVRDVRGPKPLVHHIRHSPTGFNWGEGGEGPADLARSILFDSFGIYECPASPEECQCESLWVEPTYQAFKSDVVSKLEAGEDWKLLQQDVTDWTFDYLGQETQDDTPRPVKASR